MQLWRKKRRYGDATPSVAFPTRYRSSVDIPASVTTMTFNVLDAGIFCRKLGSICPLIVVLIFIFSMNPFAIAHEGHSHGEETPKSEVAVSNPRFAVETTLFQLVGHAAGNKLTLYLDHALSNEPVAEAVVEITAGTENQLAHEVSAGTYETSSDWIASAGTHDLIVSVTAGDNADLILAQLVIPELETTAKGSSQWWENYLPIATVETGYLLVALFTIGLILGFFIRNTIFPVAGVALAASMVFTPSSSQAHDGHDHREAEAPVVQTGSQPQRLPDGSVFLPKPTQRLLKIRSSAAVLDDVAQSEQLLGRTVADPAYRGVVQAVRDGRIGFPPKGLPAIGELVKVDDVVATLVPVLTVEAQTDLTDQHGALNQEIALTRQRLNRLRAASEISVVSQNTGADVSVVSKGAIRELEVQLKVLQRRHDSLTGISGTPLNLRASLSGVISMVNVTTGQVISAGDTLIEIVDPQRILIETVAYPGQNTEIVSKARAVLPDNGSVPVTFVSRSLSLTAQAETLYFRLDNEETMPLGTPVTVILDGGKSEKNLLVPRNAVVRGASGLPVIWRQEAPETFRPQIVDTEPFDGERMKIKAGLKDGDRFVTEGASFLSQVR